MSIQQGRVYSVTIAIVTAICLDFFFFNFFYLFIYFKDLNSLPVKKFRYSLLQLDSLSNFWIQIILPNRTQVV